MIEHHHHDHEQARRQGHSHGRGRHNLVAHLFGAHSHEPGDRIDSHLEASSEGLRAVAISLGGLGATAVLQVVVVTVSGSVALLADTIHNFSDALTAIPLGLAFVLSRRRPTRRYTYGYGRAEDLAGIFIVAMIALSAGVAAWQAIGRLLDPQDVHQAGWVAVAGLIGFAGNEAVAVHRTRVGRRIGSASLVADGHHARTDGLTLDPPISWGGGRVGWR